MCKAESNEELIIDLNEKLLNRIAKVLNLSLELRA